MFSFIDRWLARFRDPVTVELDAADETFYRERRDEIAAARDRADGLRSDCRDALDDLEAVLAELEEFEDPKDRKRFNDVMENIVSDRQRMLDQLDVPRAPADLYNELDTFIAEFREMSRKESAILEHTDGTAAPMFRALDRVEEQNEQVGEFLDGHYNVMDRYDQLQEHVTRREQLQEQYNQLQDEMDDIDVDTLRERQEQVADALEELQDSDLWDAYQSLQMELDAVRSEQRQVRQTMTSAMGQMERGLKKLLYTADNGNITLDVNMDILEAIRDRDHETVLQADPQQVEDAVIAARDALPDNLLDRRQQDKFADGADTLASFSDLHDRHDELEHRINRLESKVDHHDAAAKQSRLKQEKQAAQERVEAAKERKQELRTDLNQTEHEIDLVEEDIQALFEDAFHRDVEIRQ